SGWRPRRASAHHAGSAARAHAAAEPCYTRAVRCARARRPSSLCAGSAARCAMVSDFVEYLAFSHLATIVTAIGSIIFALQLFRSRRSAQSILAWLLAFVFVPAVAIPSYFLFGTRKLARRRVRAPRAANDAQPRPERPTERVLWASGVAAAS